MRLPQPLDAQAHSNSLGHGAAGPMRGLVRRIRAGEFENPGDDLGRERRAAGLARLVAQQALDPRFGIPRLPPPDGGSADARPSRRLKHRQALGGKKNDLRPLHMFVRTIAIADNGEQTLAIFSRRKDTDGLSHAARLAHPSAHVNHMIVSVH